MAHLRDIYFFRNCSKFLISAAETQLFNIATLFLIWQHSQNAQYAIANTYLNTKLRKNVIASLAFTV